MNANHRSKLFFDISNDPLITQNAYWLENARIAYSCPANSWEIATYVRNSSYGHYLIGATDLTRLFGLLEPCVGHGATGQIHPPAASAPQLPVRKVRPSGSAFV
jgi:hypothetical protein